jgi:hypothetical protein
MNKNHIKNIAHKAFNFKRKLCFLFVPYYFLKARIGAT